MPSITNTTLHAMVNVKLKDRLDFSSLAVTSSLVPDSVFTFRQIIKGIGYPVPCDGDMMECTENASWIMTNQSAPDSERYGRPADFLCIACLLMDLGPEGNLTVVSGEIRPAR